MQIKLLGTAAYERIPAMFCQCAACEQARKLGGKNIRTQAQAIINKGRHDCRIRRYCNCIII